MPSSPGYKRDYKRERQTAIARGEVLGHNSDNAKRKRARRALQSALGRKLASDEHVDHKKPIRSGGSNDLKNLRIRNASSNTSDNGHKPKRKK